jgi:hypothetical protein
MRLAGIPADHFPPPPFHEHAGFEQVDLFSIFSTIFSENLKIKCKACVWSGAACVLVGSH